MQTTTADSVFGRMLRRHRGSVADDGGHILVLTGLLIAPLLVFAAFATDVGAWVTTASRIQRSVDAAALAGASELPDLADAEAVATEVLNRNGYSGGARYSVSVVADFDGGVVVSVTDTDPPMFFSGLVLPSMSVQREATAITRAPITMGSPGNSLGNDPTTGYAPNVWLAIFGPETVKASGDRFHTKRCRSATNVGCDSNGRNDEHRPEGYLFTVDVDGPSTTGPLRFEIFDPFVHDVGDYCDHPFLLDPGTAAAQPFYATNQAGLANFPPERYEKGRHGWCVSDNGRAGTNITTTVLIRKPDLTPGNPLDNPIVCAANFGHDVPSDNTDFVNRLTSNATTAIDRWEFSGATLQSAPINLPFRDYFRNWVSVCDIANPVTGTYIMQIRTNANQGAPPLSLATADDSITTQSRNRFSLRSGFGSDPTDPGWQTGVSLSARDALVTSMLLAPDPAGATVGVFYLARVPVSHAGEQVVMDFYDISDGNADLDLEIKPPASFTAAGGTVACRFEKNGVDFPTTGPCKIREQASAGDGKNYQAIIDIPFGYTCNQADSYDCWFTLEMTFYGVPNDTATWSVGAPGKPTRITR